MTTNVPDLPPNEKQRVRERLTLFYTNHAADNMATVERAMQIYVTEEIIFQKLYAKYNVAAADEEREARAKGVFPGCCSASPASGASNTTSGLEESPNVSDSS